MKSRNVCRWRLVRWSGALRVVVLVLCCCLQGVAAWAQEMDAPVARVNGETISQRELVNRLLADYGEGILDQLITELLVAQEAKRLGINVTDVDVDQRLRKQAAQLPEGTTLEEFLRKQNPPIGMTTYREILRMLLRLEKMVEKEVSVTEAEVVQFLRSRPDLAEQPEQIKVEGLVVRDRKLADELYQEASRRKQDFEKLARLYNNRQQRVDRVELGWQRSGTVLEIPPNAAKGYVSPPIEATPGTGIFWIYRVVDKQAGRKKSLEEAKKAAREALLELKLADKASERLAQIRKQNERNIQKMLPQRN
ncbi:MAG: peptidyl-prolyl cis-trans isomerase [Abditibacteriales bacterium]|nr:peptidyl-prolyl cis-trans isomerase [Abditibacteriales bacterium]MDW8367195.1 peptidyl-prolyl cis-trans isomerase [Abditibacteriales bacterium]